MLALSLWRPWPYAITDLGPDCKDIENRSWAPPQTLIGQDIALHAAKAWDGDAFSFFIQMGLRIPDQPHEHPHGVIFAVVRIDRVVTDPNKLNPSQRRWFFTERPDGKKNYGWVLTNVRKVLPLIGCNGRQGLWRVPEFVEMAVRGTLDAQKGRVA